MIVAVASTPDRNAVERFAAGNPVLVYADGAPPRLAEGDCCGSLVAALGACDVVLCTGIGEGAVHHLAESGIRVAMVAPGLPPADVAKRFRAGILPVRAVKTSACAHQPHRHGGDDCSCR